MTATTLIKRISITLCLSGCAVLLHLVSGLQPWWALQFSELSVPGAFRVLTCHWLHWSANHLVWDLAVFAVLGAICEWRAPRRYTWTLLLSGTAIPLCVMHWLPQLHSYRGLSGIDTALFGLLVSDLLVQKVKEHDWKGSVFFSLFVIGLFGKITLEMISHANIFVSDTSFVPVPLAHLAGAMIGLTMGAAELMTLSPRRESRPVIFNNESGYPLVEAKSP